MSTATIEKPVAKTGVDPETMPLINIAKLRLLAAEYAKDRTLPRVTGADDPKDQSENPIPVGELIILPILCQELEEQLTAILQDRFKRATYNMSASFDPDSGGVIQEKFRVVPGFSKLAGMLKFIEAKSVHIPAG